MLTDGHQFFEPYKDNIMAATTKFADEEEDTEEVEEGDEYV